MTGSANLMREVAALGANWNADVLAATDAIFERAVETSAPGVERIADVAYGDHARQRLDVYVPQRGGAEVLLFFPGGGFTGGGKDEHPSFHRNIGTFFAKQGFLTFIANYRLAPEFLWADQTSDVAGAVHWVSQHAQAYGDAGKGLSLIGHSAGAVNVAGFIVHPRYRGNAEAAGVRQAVLISGVYGFTPQSPPNVRLYAGEQDTWPDKSPLTHIARCPIPLALCAAELDPAVLADPTIELAAASARVHGHYPPMHVFAGHNHASTVRSIGSPERAVGEWLSSRILNAATRIHPSTSALEVSSA